MNQNEWLGERFEEHRAHLRAVAYRMLGSLTDADDAVQDAWLRLSRSRAGEIENLGGWLTTTVARVCLNMLRARTTRREESFEVHVPDLVIIPDGELQPEEERDRPTRSAWLSSSYSILWPRLRGWRSSSMTCSSCLSRRLPPWLGAPPRRRGSSPVGHGAA